MYYLLVNRLVFCQLSENFPEGAMEELVIEMESISDWDEHCATLRYVFIFGYGPMESSESLGIFLLSKNSF